MNSPPAEGSGHGLVINLGRPLAVSWKVRAAARTTVFPTGAMCIGSPGQPIPEFHWSEPLTNAVVHLASHLFPAADSSGPFELVSEMGVSDPQVVSLIRLMRLELEAGAPAGPLFGESLGHALAVYLRKRYSASPLRITPNKGGLGPGRRRLVLDFIRENFDTPLALSGLASEAGLSVFHFSRAFKQELGLTPHQFVLKLRIDRAKQLLAHSSYDLAEISRLVGFAGASHLGRVFRRITGETPAAFRAQLRGSRNCSLPAAANTRAQSF